MSIELHGIGDTSIGIPSIMPVRIIQTYPTLTLLPIVKGASNVASTATVPQVSQDITQPSSTMPSYEKYGLIAAGVATVGLIMIMMFKHKPRHKTVYQNPRKEKMADIVIVRNQKDMDAIPKGFDGIIEIRNAKGIIVVKNGLNVRVYDRSKVDVYGSSEVGAYDQSEVIAYGKSVVFAKNKAMVATHDNSIVYAYDRSEIQAYDDSFAEAYDHSTIEAFEKSTVKAHEKSIVEINDDATLKDYRKEGY